MPEPNQERLMKDAKRVLENLFWPNGLDCDKMYSRLHDDRDGKKEGIIGVHFSPDGDAWIGIHGSPNLANMLRFRTQFGGGGESPRVHNALRLLALAIKLDNEEKPQDIS